MKLVSRKRVVVGMSGGVDSSVAAALLLEQGFDVIGVMLRLWSEPGQEGANRCCTPDAMAQARRVSAQLGIPFYALDAQERFRESVVQYFIDSSMIGITPNPCILCNRFIRWGFLYERAREDFEAEFFATGHYARRVIGKDGGYHLHKAIDTEKDQSYVLHQLNQEQLSHTLLPIGEFHKSEIREIARQRGFSVANRPDSQDLCFLAGGDYRDFLTKYADTTIQPGEIVDRAGKKLGMHQGLPFYTIGQRKGLKLSASEPYYVLEKQPSKNQLVVGTIGELGRSYLKIGGINWIAGHPPSSTFHAQVKIRYKAALADANISVCDGDVEAIFETPLRDITPGQFAVIYDGDEVLGGGEILSTELSREDK